MAPKKNAAPPAHPQTIRTFINGKIATEVVSLGRKDKGRALRRLGAPVVGNTNRVEKARSHGLPFQGKSKQALARARKRAEKEKAEAEDEEEDEDEDEAAGGEDETAAVSVPAGAVGMIIGRMGRSIREMQDTTGCKINVSQQPQPGQAEREIELVGSREAINQAKAAIEEKVAAVKQKREGSGGEKKSGPRLGAHDTTVGK